MCWHLEGGEIVLYAFAEVFGPRATFGREHDRRDDDLAACGIRDAHRIGLLHFVKRLEHPLDFDGSRVGADSLDGVTQAFDEGELALGAETAAVARVVEAVAVEGVLVPQLAEPLHQTSALDADLALAARRQDLAGILSGFSMS